MTLFLCIDIHLVVCYIAGCQSRHSFRFPDSEEINAEAQGIKQMANIVTL